MSRPAATNAGRLQERTGRLVVEKIKSIKALEKSEADVVLMNCQKAYLDKNLARFRKAVRGRFGLLIVDEAHQGNAQRYARIISHVDAPYAMGLSATPSRKDGRDKLMPFLVGPVTARSEITTLTPEIRAFFSKSKPKTSYSTWSAAMSWVSRDETRNEEIVELVFRDIDAGHCSILVPVIHKSHMVTLTELINAEAVKRGLPSDTALALHAKADRQAILKRANSSSKITVVCGIMSIVKQGIDIKACSSVILVIPMSATAHIGAPAFRQLAFRCATPLIGKAPPRVTLMIDTVPMLRGSIRSLFWQEVAPRSRGKEVLYKVSEATAGLLSRMPRAGVGTGPARGKGWVR